MDTNIFRTIHNSFNDRVRSPFYGAFIVTCLVCNWKIWFAVFFFSADDRGGKNIVDFIQLNYLSWRSCFVLPLLISVFVYILILPWIDYLALWYSEWVKQEKLKRKLKVQSAYVVDGKKYVELLEKYNTQIKHVDEYYEKMISANHETETVHQQLDKLDQENQHLTKQNKEIAQKNDLYVHRADIQTRFSGRWTMVKKMQGENVGRASVNIQGTAFTILTNDVDDIKHEILYSDFDLIRKRFVFVTKSKEDKSKEDKISYFDLNIINDHRFEGYENRTFFVSFAKDLVTIREGEKEAPY